MISKNLLDKLEKIIKEDYGKNLNQKELYNFATNLLLFFELLFKISSEKT